MRRAALLLLVGLAAVGVLLLFVFPIHTLLTQRQQISQTQQRIAALRKEDAALAARVKGLRSPAGVERLAHKDFGMVLPAGHKPYTIVPAAPNTTTTTSTTTTTVPRRGRTTTTTTAPAASPTTTAPATTTTTSRGG